MRIMAAVLGYKVRITLEPASPEEIADELETLAPLESVSVPESPSAHDGHQESSQKEPSAKAVHPQLPPKETKKKAVQANLAQRKTSTQTAKTASPQKKASTASKQISGQVSRPATASQPLKSPSQDPMEGMLSDARSFAAAVHKKPMTESASTAVEGADNSQLPVDCINPYNGKEYLPNTVRKHPELEHYIQVYDQLEHGWVDVAEDFFLRFQEQKRQMLGKDYSQPIYI